MAQTIACDFCGQRAANLLIGNLDNGQQIAVCYVDVPTACEQLINIAGVANPLPDVPTPEAPATAPEVNGAGAQPAPRPSQLEGEAPASDGADGSSETQETETATADAS